MHPLLRPSILASLFVLAAAPAAAQGLTSLPRVQTYGALSLGAQRFPDELQSRCAPGAFGALEARAGARSDVVALEVRGAVMSQFSSAACPDLARPEAAGLTSPPEDGIYLQRIYGFDTVDPTVALDARLRIGGTRALPVVASVGAGRLAGPGVPYVLAGVGYRSPGRVRLAVDVERQWYRVEYEEVARLFEGGFPAGEFGRESHSAWWNGTGVRLGVEMDLF